MNLKTIKGVKTISFLALFVVFVAGVMLVAYPLFTSTQKFAQDYSAAEADLMAAEQKLTALQGDKANINKVIEIDEETKRAFPSAANTPTLIEDITSAATDAGLSIGNIKELTTGVPVLTVGDVAAVPAAPVEGEAEAPADAAAAPAPNAPSTSTLAEMSINIVASGSLDQLIRFTENLKDNDKRNVLISSYSIGKEGSEEGEYNLTITGKTYIYNEVVPPSDEAATAPVEGEAVEVEVAETP